MGERGWERGGEERGGREGGRERERGGVKEREREERSVSEGRVEGMRVRVRPGEPAEGGINAWMDGWSKE